MEFMDELVTRILLNVSHEHVLDICNVILLVLILLVADAFLRIIAEVFQYNKDHNRKNTTKTFITTLIWYGWGQGDYIDANTGKIKRYLMSEKLRSSMLKKICLFYPAWFFLSIACVSLPDTVFIGVRGDELLANVFMWWPVASELSSIIENLREIDTYHFVRIKNMFMEINKMRK